MGIRIYSMYLLQQSLEPRFPAPNIAGRPIVRRRFGAQARGPAPHMDGARIALCCGVTSAPALVYLGCRPVKFC
jgi:hypothetical protein